MMKTKLHLLLSLFFLSFVANAQNQDDQVANSIVRNMLVYQMMNDFSTVVPAFFFVPGWFVFSSFQVTHVPVFVDETYYSTADVKSQKDALHKELFEALNIDFFPEIPDDKLMEVRVTDQNRLLYRLQFYREADTLVVMQISGKNLDEKGFSISGGELFQITKKDQHGISYRKSEFLGDTLHKIRDYDSKKDIFYHTEIRFSDGQLDTKTTFQQRSQGKSKLISTEKYYYLNKLLSLIEKQNRSGSILETTTYLYNLDNRIISMNKRSLKVNLVISYSYNDEGLINSKTFQTGNMNYSLQYYRDNGKISGFLIAGLSKSYTNELTLAINLQNQLSRIQHKKEYKDRPNMVRAEEMLFDYQSNGNIGSIRIYDIQGRITKDISFEYAYFNL